MLEPDAVSLREWVADDVTELVAAPVSSALDTWYDVVVALDASGGVTVYRGPKGGPFTEVLSGTTTLAAGGPIGFGVGERGDYDFDDVRLVAPSVSQARMGVKYAYDALGRKAARTVYATDGTPSAVYYVYSGDQLLEEVDAQGNVLASYVYGLYVDEPLQMQRGGQTYRYLQDVKALNPRCCVGRRGGRPLPSSEAVGMARPRRCEGDRVPLWPIARRIRRFGAP